MLTLTADGNPHRFELKIPASAEGYKFVLQRKSWPLGRVAIANIYWKQPGGADFKLLRGPIPFSGGNDEDTVFRQEWPGIRDTKTGVRTKSVARAVLLEIVVDQTIDLNLKSEVL